MREYEDVAHICLGLFRISSIGSFRLVVLFLFFSFPLLVNSVVFKEDFRRCHNGEGLLLLRDE